MTDSCPGAEYHHHAGGENDDCRAVMGFNQDQGADQADDNQRREQPPFETVQIGLLYGHDRSGVDEQAQFGQLRGLNRQGADLNPPGSAIGLHPDDGHKNQQQEDHTAQQNPTYIAPVQGERDVGEREKQDQAEPGPGELPFKKIVTVIEFGPSLIVTGTANHHQSESQQEKREEHQPKNRFAAN